MLYNGVLVSALSRLILKYWRKRQVKARIGNLAYLILTHQFQVETPMLQIKGKYTGIVVLPILPGGSFHGKDDIRSSLIFNLYTSNSNNDNY